MKKTALIMAGGKGERFWPRSRKALPKQFLALTDEGKTMIQLTVERILPMVAAEDIYIATNRDYRSLVREQLPQIPEENILCEPVGRNTAPCIGLGAVHMAEKYGDSIMLVLPADHFISYNTIFRSTLEDACRVAEEHDDLVTLGITPNKPETGYGYIRFDPDRRVGPAFAVEQFVEKPDLETAKEYLASQQYFWNSGMFIWKTSVILDSIKRYLPELYEGLCRIRASLGSSSEEQVLAQEFDAFPSESVDYGVMEKAENICTISGSFGWDDVGSWPAVARLKKSDEFGNVLSGRTAAVNSKNCIIQGRERLIAAVGLDNVIIVDTEDALLVCSRENAEDIKKVLENLRLSGHSEYL